MINFTKFLDMCPMQFIPNAMKSLLFLLSRHTVITDYQMSRDSSNSQQQPTASNIQTSKLLPDSSLKQKWKPPKYISDYSNAFANIVPANTVPNTSNDLICGYIVDVHFCLYTTEASHEFCYHQSEFYKTVLYIYLDNMTIIKVIMLPVIFDLS